MNMHIAFSGDNCLFTFACFSDNYDIEFVGKLRDEPVSHLVVKNGDDVKRFALHDPTQSKSRTCSNA